jgi:hypothetical protein
MMSTRFLGGVAALALGLALSVPSVSFGAEYGQRGGGGGGARAVSGGAPAVSGGARVAGGATVNSRVTGASVNSYAAVRSSSAPGAPNYAGRTAGNPTWNGGRTAVNPNWNGDRWNDGRWNGGWYGGGPIIGGGYAYFGPDYYDYGPDYSYYDNGYSDEGTAVAVAPGADATWCAQTYRSYDPASGTYLGFDGQRHPCP